MSGDDEEEKNKTQKKEELQIAFHRLVRNYTTDEATDEELMNALMIAIDQRRSRQYLPQDSNPNNLKSNTTSLQQEITEVRHRQLSPPNFQSTPFESTNSSHTTCSLSTTPEKKRFNIPSPVLKSAWNSPPASFLFDDIGTLEKTTPDLSAPEPCSVLLKSTPFLLYQVSPNVSSDKTLIASSSSLDSIPKTLSKDLPSELSKKKRIVPFTSLGADPKKRPDVLKEVSPSRSQGATSKRPNISLQDNFIASSTNLRADPGKFLEVSPKSFPKANVVATTSLGSIPEKYPGVLLKVSPKENIIPPRSEGATSKRPLEDLPNISLQDYFISPSTNLGADPEKFLEVSPKSFPKENIIANVVATSLGSIPEKYPNENIKQSSSQGAISKRQLEYLPKVSSEGLDPPLPQLSISRTIPEVQLATNQNVASTDEDVIPSFTKIMNKCARTTNETDTKTKISHLRKSTWFEGVLPIKIGDILQADNFIVDDIVYFKYNDIVFRTVLINGVVRSIDLRENKCHFLLYDDTGCIEVRYLFKNRLFAAKQKANEAYRKSRTILQETRLGTLQTKYEVSKKSEIDQKATYRLAKKTILLGRCGPMHTDIKFGMHLIIAGTVQQYFNVGADLVRVIHPWAVQERRAANIGNTYRPLP